MISTPAGSTGWSRSYGGPVLPHDANLNILTPVGGFSPRGFSPVLLPDKGRIRIQNDTSRENPLDILVDNRRIVSMESRPIELTIERATHGVDLLIASSYRERW
jgi:NAD+ kinase